jgi:hypothetical protein
MSPLPPWFDLILFPLAIASLFGFGLFLSDRLVSLFSSIPRDHPFDWGGEVEKMAVTFGLGYGFLSLSMLGLGLLGALYGPVLWSVLALGLLLFFRLANRFSVIRGWSELQPRGRLEWFLFGFLCFYFAFRYLGALVPGWGYDEMMYHLTLPRQFLLAHRIHPTPNLIQANLPLNAQMAFVFLYGLGGDILCHLFQWSQYLVLVAIVVRWARRLNEGAGYLAVLVYCSSTLGVYFKVPEEVHSDGPVAVYFATAMLVLGGGLTDRRRLGVALAGLFNGLAWGTKYTAFVFTTPLLMAYLVLKLLDRKVSRISLVTNLATFLFVSFLAFAPWMARGYSFTGNPVYPLLGILFPSPPPYDAMAERLREYEAYSNFYARDPVLAHTPPLYHPFRTVWVALRSLRSDKTAWSIQNGDFLLLLNLAIPFLGFVIRDRETKRLCYTALVGNLLYVFVYGMHLSRFYSSVFPLAAVLVARAIGLLAGKVHRPRALRWTVSMLMIFHLCYWQVRWLALQDWWGRPCLTHEAQRRFILKRYGGIEGLEKDRGGWEKALSDHTPQDAYVLAHRLKLPIHSPRRMYYIGDFEEELLVRLSRGAESPLALAQRLRGHGFTHYLFHKPTTSLSDLQEAWLDTYTESIWEDDQLELRRLLPPTTR